MSAPPPEDLGVGMMRYGTASVPCSARVRVRDEDFIVEEVLELEGLSKMPREGFYPLYLVQKRGIDTLHMEKELSMVLKSKVSFGGLKDKRATATQYVTPTNRKGEAPQEVQGRGFFGKLVGYLPKPVSRGDVVGNRFTVVMRECCPRVEESVREAFALGDRRRIPNYFGRQRFGSGKGSHLIGRAIVHRRFEEAAQLILGVEGTSDYEELLESLAKGQDTERLVARHLVREPSDFVGALRAVQVRLRRLFVHAYQSYIFNLTLSLALDRGLRISEYQPGDNWAELGEDGLTIGRTKGVRDAPTNRAVPVVQIPGYAHRDYGSRFDSLLGEVMKGEGVSGRDFFVKGMEETSAEGGFRIPFLTIQSPLSEFSGSDATLAFSLGRGQYATVLLREILKE